ncbi:acyl-CoA dehydrogenase family protein [Pseudomonas tructae]|uniref:Acyl-CoA dehydrogenase family protein n=1 Tax=Pseudomonas tructae TaxID=2518644 RepID=A0A411MNM4_9PSED|nr:acyl-CoA dehydrogenase family protein [Pseudomonas tructae]QBF28429.1 acyl-CoA dehydrogenase family protein [Pseudomonas tructae]
MKLSWTPQQHALLVKYREIGAELATARKTATPGFDHYGWQRLCDAGLWQLVIPASHGGLGEDWWGFTAALEGLASSIRTPELLLSVIAQAGMVRALMLYGSDEQKDRYLTAILNGALSATGIAEPGTGTDVRSIHSLLTPVGDGYRLNGSKFNIAHAPVADFMLIVTKLDTDAKANIALVMIDKDTPGLTRGEPDDKLGNKHLPTGPLYFDNLAIPASQVLGQPGRGLQQLIKIISLGRLYYGLVAANLPTPFLDEAMQYAAQRQSFNSTIDNHQYVQKRLVDLVMGMERNRWMVYAALDQLLNDHPQALMSCSIAKLGAAQDFINSAISLLKLYGSLGYHEGDVANLVKDALGFASVGGTEEMHQKNIFNQLLRLTQAA